MARDDSQENQFGDVANESARDPANIQTRGDVRATRAVELVAPESRGAPVLPTISTTGKRIDVTADVLAVLSSRPVNGFDGFLPAILTVSPSGPVVCDLLTDPPSPLTYDEGLIGGGNYNQVGVSCAGCGPLSQGGTDDTGTTNHDCSFRAWNGNAVQINVYFWINGVLVWSALDQDGSTTISTGIIHGINPGDVLVGAVTCVNSDDTWTGDLRLTITVF